VYYRKTFNLVLNFLVFASVFQVNNIHCLTFDVLLLLCYIIRHEILH